MPAAHAAPPAASRPYRATTALFFLLLHGLLLPAPARSQPGGGAFCGITAGEARAFCHLPPAQSLPCPDGPGDCPYNMPCWELATACTAGPTAGPTGAPTAGPQVAPTASPLTRRGAPGDHHFCGIGFDNLFGCAVNCPNGSPVECPAGQLCYFNTNCDARVEGGLLHDPTGSPTPAPTGPPSPAPMSTPTPAPTPRPAVPPPDGRHNFCGASVEDSEERCGRDRHCPLGNNNECAEGTFCYVNVKGCDFNEMPSAKPTASPRPTTAAPTTQSPEYTYEPTPSPLDKDDIRALFFCGTSWGDASSRCYKRCLSGGHEDCPGDEECFAQAACSKGVITDDDTETEDSTSSDGSDSPTWSLAPTPLPKDTFIPTQSPLERDDPRRYFFCGTSWRDASERCHQRCVSSHHSECPGDEECFAQADCKRGVIVPKTKRPTNLPTPMPIDGTRAPTASPTTPFPTTSAAPSTSPIEPPPTQAPVRQPTASPSFNPTATPTTPFPTNRPTYGPCQGAPCANKEHCRSNQNFCGPGKYYCNEKSIWIESCGTPTKPPVSAAPTTVIPSRSPSTSGMPTRTATMSPTGSPTTKAPTGSPTTKAPTGSPFRRSDIVYYLRTYSPTKGPQPTNQMETHPPTHPSRTPPGSPGPSSGAPTVEMDTYLPTHGDHNDVYYAPDDPLGTFFCGTDWNHAITACPHRCPSGEASQCPNGWACYAFTPCFGVGLATAPTPKPTWEPTKTPTTREPTTLEPTKRPTPHPTRKVVTAVPTTARQYWAKQNSELNEKSEKSIRNTQTPTPKPVWWTPAPSPKPTYAPTEDQCRGVPCDYRGECRSRLGFCGTGIVYCNSASVWAPKCGGASTLMKPQVTPSPSAVPTKAPFFHWEAWASGEEDAIVTSDADGMNSIPNSSEDEVGTNIAADTEFTTKEEAGEEEESISGSNSDGWAVANWQSRESVEENGDFRWWLVRNSSTIRMPFLRMPTLLWALLFSAVTSM